ncbi:MAG: TylF/MycF/NovP-related O-methyltransferase [Alteraurantiacibacter sp.]
MASSIAKSMVARAINTLGPKRVLRSIRHGNSALVGAYVDSDYPKHLHDGAFLAVYERAKEFTLVDVLRQHELWSLVQQAGKLAPGDILEVGVWRGGTALIVGKAMQRFGVEGQLYIADTFTGVVKAGVNDNLYAGGEHADASEEQVRALMARNGVVGTEILTGIFPEDTSDRIRGALRMVHIDVDVYQGARDVVEWAYDRLVPQGFFVFDDYGCASCSGVTGLCEEYETDSRFIFVHNWNGHCVLIKRG